MKAVLSRLRDFRLVYNPLKSKFFQTSITFLGHHIDKDGITSIERNKTRIIDFTPPLTSPP